MLRVPLALGTDLVRCRSLTQLVTPFFLKNFIYEYLPTFSFHCLDFSQ
jgi:hypothetical protein